MVSTVFSQKRGKTSTIIGDVIDIKSYVMYNMKADTPDRKEAVVASVNAGNPIGILESKTGNIYLVVTAKHEENANARLTDYLGLHVYVKGNVYQKGKIQLIALRDIGKSVK
jgi:hypothetical protein